MSGYSIRMSGYRCPVIAPMSGYFGLRFGWDREPVGRRSRAFNASLCALDQPEIPQALGRSLYRLLRAADGLCHTWVGNVSLLARSSVCLVADVVKNLVLGRRQVEPLDRFKPGELAELTRHLSELPSARRAATATPDAERGAEHSRPEALLSHAAIDVAGLRVSSCSPPG